MTQFFLALFYPCLVVFGYYAAINVLLRLMLLIGVDGSIRSFLIGMFMLSLYQTKLFEIFSIIELVLVGYFFLFYFLVMIISR